MAPILLPAPNFRGTGATGVDALVVFLAVISVALRFCTRVFTKAGLGPDDWLILAAVIVLFVTIGIFIWSYSIEDDSLYTTVSLVTAILYFNVTGATKLSVLLMYNRIFAVSKAFRYQLFVASGLVVAWWVGCTIASWFDTQGNPRYWFEYKIFWMAAGVGEIFLDALILTLPAGVVMRMRLSLKQKATVLGIFMLGGFVIVTGVIRVVLGYSPGSATPSYYGNEVWTIVHGCMAIFCANLPIFNPLVRRVAESCLITRISNLCSPTAE